jgi:hypothetical protein
VTRSANMKPPEPTFREEQRFPHAVLMVLFGAMAVYAIGYWIYLLWGRLSGGEPTSDVDAALIMVPVLALATLGLAAQMWFARLETEACDDGLHVRFRGFFVCRAIPYGKIASCGVQTYNPLTLLGTGRTTVLWSFGHGRIYRVRGNRGVQLELTDGEKLLIGSQQADELAAAINAHLS